MDKKKVIKNIEVGDFVTTTQGNYKWKNYDPDKRHKVIRLSDGMVHLQILDDGGFDNEWAYCFYETWITGVYK